jgi:hypothetical protein
MDIKNEIGITKWEYLDNIVDGITSGKERMFYNGNITDYIATLAAIMKTSTDISIFCSEMLMFKSSKLQQELIDVGETEEDAQSKIQIFKEYVTEFLNKQGKLEVVFQETPTKDFWNQIDQEYITLFQSDNVKIYQLSADVPSIVKSWNHFSVSKDDTVLYQYGLDRIKHNAIVFTNDHEGAEIFTKSFDLLKNISQSIEFKKNK